MSKTELRLRITQNYYAPKVALQDQEAFPENSHMVVCCPCNFRCEFCDFWDNPDIEFKYISLPLFDKTVRYLMGYGPRFKFTGGEPTLNRHLPAMLETVKRHRGVTFLDSNGSRPEIIRELAVDGLIDVLGVSLKGLSPQDACKTAGITNARLAWHNPIETIAAVCEISKVVLVVTHVFTHPFRMEDLRQFAVILESFGDQIILKVNNLLPNPRNGHLQAVSADRLEKAVKELVELEPRWAGRVVLVNSRAAISQGEAVVRL